MLIIRDRIIGCSSYSFSRSGLTDRVSGEGGSLNSGRSGFELNSGFLNLSTYMTQVSIDVDDASNASPPRSLYRRSLTRPQVTHQPRSRQTHAVARWTVQHMSGGCARCRRLRC
uniref:Uncharacterized protein n=1 Tax=Cacopsylla melanoneura TaxID=428564 RepID=A0A8D8SWS6_9HEMI